MAEDSLGREDSTVQYSTVVLSQTYDLRLTAFVIPLRAAAFAEKRLTRRLQSGKDWPKPNLEKAITAADLSASLSLTSFELG